MKFLSIDFINTKWYGTHQDLQDHLLNESLFLRFLTSHEILPTVPITPENIRALFAFREFLESALIEWVNKKNISEGVLSELQQVLERTSYIKKTQTENGSIQLSLQPIKKDVDWIFSEIAASFIQLLSVDDSRLRICDNPDCGWFFYDETRNRSKKCCDETCSTLLKVRRFRANKKEEKALSQR